MSGKSDAVPVRVPQRANRGEDENTAREIVYALVLMGLILMAFTVLTSILRGDDAPARTADNLPLNANGQVDFGTVQSAHALLGAAVKMSGGEQLGKVENVGLDIGTGKVAAVFIRPGGRGDLGKERESLSVAITSLKWTDDGGILLAAPQESRTKATARDDFGDRSQVVLLSGLGEVVVREAGGKVVGRVVDFGIARQSGLIPYATMVLEGHSADTYYPIPLGAFVVPKGVKNWILELPAGILADTPSFDKHSWPSSVPLAWTEYVRVRYGRPPSGGVERELRSLKK